MIRRGPLRLWRTLAVATLAAMVGAAGAHAFAWMVSGSQDATVPVERFVWCWTFALLLIWLHARTRRP